MKTILKILAGFVVLIAAIFGFVFWATAGLPDTANSFFTRIAADDYAGAIALTTPDFRASTDRAALERFARENGFDKYQSADWSSRSFNNNLGSLEGSLRTNDGGVIPVTLQLVKADDGWRIQNVLKAQAGAVNASSDPYGLSVPTAEKPDAKAP